jgi:iron complex outermembrane receptor protein
MNGVINIITRSSFDTTGSTLSTSVGTEEQITSFSHVFDVNDDTSVRAWGKFKAHDNQVYHNGEDSHDAWQQGRIGFRLDSILNETDTLTVHGSTYQGTSDQDIIILENLVEFKDTQDLSGTYLMGEWSRTDANQSLKAHIYADHMIRDDMRINQRVNTFDTAVQQTVAHNEQGEFTWELNYRYVTDASSNPVGPSVFASSLFQLIPGSMNYEMFGVSLQEAYWLTDDVRLMAGVRFDNSESTGWSAQPSLRALWKVSDNVELWSSLSHSIRSPFRYETSLTVTLPPLIDVASNNDPKNESLNTVELGLRMRPAENVSFNVTAFHNQYKNLISLTELLRIDNVFVPGLPPIPFTYHSLLFSNEIDAVSYGAEMDVRWDVSEAWRLKMSYSWMRVSSDDVSESLWSAVAFNNLPLHQVYLNSAWDLTDKVELDATLSYIDELQESGVDAYTRFDLRLGWTPRPDLELSLIGRNLFDDQHAEYLTTSSNLGGGVGSSEIERSITAQLVYKF